MAEILSINGAEVKIGEDDGKVITTPIATLQFANPKVGDKVDVYRDGKEFIIKRSESSSCGTVDGERSINKHVFVWIGTFMFGCFGVDRFMRGQVGLGVLKLLLCSIGWITIVGGIAGWIWTMVDWITGMVKAYGGAYGNTENITFDENGNYIN